MPTGVSVSGSSRKGSPSEMPSPIAASAANASGSLVLRGRRMLDAVGVEGAQCVLRDEDLHRAERREDVRVVPRVRTEPA